MGKRERHTILPNNQHCCCSAEEAAGRTEGHKLEEGDHIPEVDNPEQDIPVVDKRLWDTLLVDNLYQEINSYTEIRPKKPINNNIRSSRYHQVIATNKKNKIHNSQTTSQQEHHNKLEKINKEKRI